MTKSLENILNQLGLIENNAVYFREKKNGNLFNGFSSEIQKKINIIKPDAFYVFNQLPFVLFFDLTQDVDIKREIEIFKQVWSFDTTPVVFIVKNTDISVFNAFSYCKKNNRLEEIELTEEERNERFSFWNLQSGVTWKNWFQQEYIDKERSKKKYRRSNQQLFENIKQVREALTGTKTDSPLTDDEANTLILRLIFIRYLIDRGVNIDSKYISGTTILEKRLSFCKLIETPNVLNQLFDKLNQRFNGVLFKSICVTLTDGQSKALAKVFNGERPDIGTLFHDTEFYFEIFDFSIIPVEVISGIYESLIDEDTRKLDSAVYTPAFLVENILSGTVERHLENNATSECKIFDPSVGSGIFLVQALRKMIDKEIALNGIKNKKQFSERIRAIAKDNLFGIDINLQALKVTCFSIYIALLDYQEPKDIDKYEFPYLLEENLFEANFFDVNKPYNTIIKSKNLDFIVGNPPWKSDKDRIHLEWLKSQKHITGGYEIAQSFLIRSKDFMQFHTNAALIVTSTIFYNVADTTKKFKSEFLKAFCINRFIDLSPVRRLIFEEKNSPASIVFYRRSKENEYLTNIVRHQSVKPNWFLKYFKLLVIEKYDNKEILQRHFLDNEWMFKIALYGNTLDFEFINELKSKGVKLIDFLSEKKVRKGAGIMLGDKEKYTQYSDIVGKKLLINTEVKEYFSNSVERRIKGTDAHLKSGRIEGLYDGFQILFKEQAKDESNIVASITESPHIFKKGVFGISSSNKALIESIYSVVVSDLYTYFIFMTSGSWGTSTRPQIRWNDEFLSFQYIEPDKIKKKELFALVDRFLLPYRNYYKKFTLGEPIKNDEVLQKINDEINEIYEVSGYKKDLVDYVLKVARYQFQESKQEKYIHKIHTDKAFLEKYASVFVSEFSKIYPNEALKVEVFPLEHFVAMNFVFCKTTKDCQKEIVFPENRTNEAEILKHLGDNLSISKITNSANPFENLFLQKDIKGFDSNSFYIIKPNEYKCWHRAMAWYDVAEFKEIIESAEIKQINEGLNDF